ncbi:hypothetical protein [Mycobacterium sherrisii]|uniref:hypothetical protein n=1 Tax=Mycobacterium sherrisii TaxID=243061 RepID=UPI001B803D05|nr:hypothetical protein [Mycobacterium sherrisii]MCV7030252.1 hypothetical protein [Mycobacterium sherrisii]
MKTTFALAADSGVEVHPPALIPPSLTDGIQRYPFNWRAVTHGWRWYRVENGQLVSPLQGYPTSLPGNGYLPGAYFIPEAFRLWPVLLMLRDTRPYDFAFTFGKVFGPLLRDFQMPRIGSMSATEYQAQVIFTDGAMDLDDSYDLPIVETEIDLILLRDIEITKDDPSWPAAAVRSAALRATVNRVVREASGPSAH